MHIGTHGRSLTDFPSASVDDLVARFLAFGWQVVWRYDGGVKQTPWGAVAFNDGVLSMHNRHPVACRYISGID